jgi:hypothetical protein
VSRLGYVAASDARCCQARKPLSRFATAAACAAM